MPKSYPTHMLVVRNFSDNQRGRGEKTGTSNSMHASHTIRCLEANSARQARIREGFMHVLTVTLKFFSDCKIILLVSTRLTLLSGPLTNLSQLPQF